MPAAVGDRLTLVDFGGRWGFVPQSEIKSLPALWPFFNRIRALLVDLWNIIFGEAKTEVTLPLGAKVHLTVSTEHVEDLFGAGPVEAIIDQYGFNVGDVVYDYQIFGEFTGLQVISLPG
jgi:hypothetical protein